MSVEGINENVQQYTIRAKREAQSANQSGESQQAIQNQNVQNEPRAAEVDSYDKDNPAGIESEGVYSISHDESGRLRVDYAPKSEESKTNQTHETSQADSESESSKPNRLLETEQPKSSGASQNESSTSSDDKLEELQRQKNEIQQQLNREQDENVKAQLRLQLQNIEAQIIQLKAN